MSWLDCRIVEPMQTFSTSLWSDAFLTSGFSPLSFLFVYFFIERKACSTYTHIHPNTVVSSMCSIRCNNKQLLRYFRLLFIPERNIKSSQWVQPNRECRKHFQMTNEMFTEPSKNTQMERHWIDKLNIERLQNIVCHHLLIWIIERESILSADK